MNNLVENLLEGFELLSLFVLFWQIRYDLPQYSQVIIFFDVLSQHRLNFVLSSQEFKINTNKSFFDLFLNISAGNKIHLLEILLLHIFRLKAKLRVINFIFQAGLNDG